ncbi:transcription regulator [Nitrogeniibacter mangrovi]|uniref:Transcription regulator n=1 Tax=Nitrogeniibacter mangrovi TaxID=2016596 RepID=A0A6C1B8Q8_9RHOO|nr:transcription regulator [Nitrogeniibacter mangrovi]QID19118.1 transcription regulator [Nitrogeniibacter mangrovi]
MVDPKMPTDPFEPDHAAAGGLLPWLVVEVRDHLWPWSRHGFQRHRALQGAGLALGLAATVVWVLAALGQLAAGALIGWWFGWSVFEVIVRLGAKPYVKEGPWWGRRYRRASRMDMICYVGFKNLLIGASLFIALKSLGLVTV